MLAVPLRSGVETVTTAVNNCGTAELLPCPFCGCTAIYVTHTNYYDPEDTVSIFCNGCKAHVTLEQNEAEGINEKTKAEAIEAWNTRAGAYCPHAQPTDLTDGCALIREQRTCKVVSEEASSWIDGKTIILHRCSECHELMRPTMRYCPNCGARVIGGE